MTREQSNFDKAYAEYLNAVAEEYSACSASVTKRPAHLSEKRIRAIQGLMAARAADISNVNTKLDALISTARAFELHPSYWVKWLTLVLLDTIAIQDNTAPKRDWLMP